METIIKCSNLTHYYGSRKIYEDLNFEVPKGRILGLLGKNGTGKTTTINILMGYLKPRSGECRIFGEDIQRMQPVTRERIALLIENHVQYTFMNIEQIERFYSAFYPKWNKEAYYELMRKLKVAPKQKISRMSCGQRSQVALGLILAQNADLLVLDDFSIGLDPGYRRLFTEYLREYAKAEEKTIFLTSHIIQDMERPHIDSEACKGIARHLHTLYLQNIVARQAPPRPVVIQHGGHTGFCRDLLVRKRRTYQTDIARAIDTLYRFQIRENESGRCFHRIDRKILILLSSEL